MHASIQCGYCQDDMLTVHVDESQVRECATALLHVAKKHDIPIFLVGHVTKSGDIAGPKVLEHIVDVVLYMEGEKHQSFRCAVLPSL